MRVAVTVEQFWHPVPGGTARATHKTVRALQRTGEIDLVGVAAAHPDGMEASELTIPVVHSRLKRPVLYESWLRLNRPRIQPLVDGCDVIWASAMVPPPQDGSALVSTVHDLEFLDHPEWHTSRGRNFFPRAFKAAAKRSDLIACPSQTVADRCADAGVEPDRLRVIPWGVSASRVEDREISEIRAHYGLPDTFVLWVGTIEPRKNLTGLAAAMQSLDVPVAVVGPDGWKLTVEDAILGPLGDRCHRLGKVPDRDLHCLYAAASVFAFPSHAEGFGLPVLEAMAQGTPVVTSRGTATEETAGGAALLVDPNDPAEIADSIERLLDDEVLAARHTALGLDRAHVMSWDTTASGYAAAFAEALG
ncbi:MAG: glycosyltransferase family 4 protein [Acidimicrobiales bacterium]|nr:glycosyltransferase family 4 protein [Acidimicrobiales bacterium]